MIVQRCTHKTRWENFGNDLIPTNCKPFAANPNLLQYSQHRTAKLMLPEPLDNMQRIQAFVMQHKIKKVYRGSVVVLIKSQLLSVQQQTQLQLSSLITTGSVLKTSRATHLVLVCLWLTGTRRITKHFSQIKLNPPWSTTSGNLQ